MLAPGDGSDHVQVIDARDQAKFVVRCLEEGIGGAFNTAGPRFTWKDFVHLLGVREVVWAPVPLLEESGVLDRLQLFVSDDGPWGWVMDVSNERALAAGLSLTPPAETLKAVRDALPDENPLPLLSAEQERELLERIEDRAA